MKPTLGILKIGANITFGANANRTAANQDIMTLSRALAPNFELHYITKRTRNSLIPKETKFTDIMLAKEKINELGLDAIMVFNGNWNAFGGYFPHETAAIWQIINAFKGKVFYIHTDCQMKFYQCFDGESWAKKGWDTEVDAESVIVTRDDIIYLTQSQSPTKILELTAKTGITLKEENILHFPIEEAILLKPPVYNSTRDIKWDLIYGGSWRSGARRDRMLKWFFGHQKPALKTLMFGNIGMDKFINQTIKPFPQFEGPVSNDQFVGKLRTSLATVIIVDKWSEGHWTPLRFYESLIAGCIPFIDILADPKKRLFKNPELQDFLYVTKRAELAERITKLREESFLTKLLYLCRQDIQSRWDREVYKASLKTLIESKL